MRVDKISGLKVLNKNIKIDNRGTFEKVLSNRNLNQEFSEISISRNISVSTLRGMHSLEKGEQEFKYLSVISGAIFDVVIDMRPYSKTYTHYVVNNMDEKDDKVLSIPPGCFHGYLTLKPQTVLLYVMSKVYKPSKEISIRWNDPIIGIKWPQNPKIISKKDQTIPNLNL